MVSSPAPAKNENSAIDVNDGRTKLGSIIPQSRTSFQARDANGLLLGVFATKAEALDAIWAAREGPK